MRKATPEYLRRAGLHYLDRYNATSQSLRQVLMRRVRNSLKAHGEEGEHTADALNDAVTALIEDFKRLGYIDDAAFARGRVRTLQLSGDSPRLMAQKLAAKGIDREDVSAAFDALVEDSAAEDLDALALDAAWHYARRRRLGPYRLDEATRGDNRDRDLARLARRGFSFDVCRTVIDAQEPPS